MPRKSKRGNTSRRGTQRKEERQYEASRKSAAGKERPARPTTAKPAAQRKQAEPRYEQWSRQDLYAQAKKVGIHGRSHMKKNELISALRAH